MKIDTSTWKPFRVGDLFGIAKHKAYINPHSLEPSLNGARIVSASMVNNGLSADTYAIGELVDAMVPSHVITWGKQSPLFAYQDEKTIPGQGVYFYEVPQLSMFQALFVCACMQVYVGPRYNYQECLIGQKMDAEFIMLPATPDGEPDWAYMETYMQQVLDREEIFAEHLASLTAKAVADGHVVDTSAWKAFKVGDLFDVSYGKFIPKSAAVMDGYPHVTASACNNGYSYNVSDAMFPAGCISVASDGSMGATFYHDEPYSAGNIVSNLVPHADVPINVYIGTFLATLIRQESYNYSWGGFKFSVDRVRETNLLLPTTLDGEPDWAYMEQYMKDVMAVEALFADELDRVYCA